MKLFSQHSSLVFTAILAAMVLFACVKDAPIETYPAVENSSCADKIQNQDEYKVDCGGPNCAPCKIEKSVITATIDSTWVLDSNKTENRFWEATKLFIDDTTSASYVSIAATSLYGSPGDSIHLRFLLPKGLGRGVHIVDTIPLGFYISKPPNKSSSTFPIEKGVFTITDVDKINGWVTGKFEFNTGPELSTLLRVDVLDGQMIDIPY